MATTEPPILIPLIESDEGDVSDALRNLAKAVLVYGAACLDDPIGERTPADHPVYVLADLTADALVRSLSSVSMSVGAHRYSGPVASLALQVRDLLANEILSRLEHRAGDAF